MMNTVRGSTELECGMCLLTVTQTSRGRLSSEEWSWPPPGVKTHGAECIACIALVIPLGGDSPIPDLQKRRAENREVKWLVQNSQDLHVVKWVFQIPPAEFQSCALSVSPRSFQMGFRVPQAWSPGY